MDWTKIGFDLQGCFGDCSLCKSLIRIYNFYYRRLGSAGGVGTSLIRIHNFYYRRFVGVNAFAPGLIRIHNFYYRRFLDISWFIKV